MYYKKPKPLQFKVGDFVRISKYKLLFEKKSASQNYTNEIFRVVKAIRSVPTNYFYLEDLNKETILGNLKKHKYI